MEKILTISIAAYNVEKYIKETLDSLVKSKAIDALEVLVVNDGSKDKTVELVQEYEKEYPNSVHLINKENGGWGSTINASLQAATGKYYKLLDGDDWFATENIEKYVDFLREANADIVFTQYTKVFEPNMDRELVECELPALQTVQVSELDKIAMHAIAIKTDLIKNKMKITEKCFYTDVEFVIKCAACAETSIYLPISIYEYRLGLGGQSVSPASYGKNFLQHKTVLKTVLPIIYHTEKLHALKKLAKNLTLDHYSVCLYATITKTTYQELKEFHIYLKKNYREIYDKVTRMKKLAGSSYFIYRIFAKIQHRKYDIIN